jgi:hypothetical protein
MQKVKNNQSGFGAVELVLVVIVLVMLSAGGWFIYQKLATRSSTSPTSTTTTTTNNTNQTTTTTDPTTTWKRVDSIGGAYSIKVPDGWELTNYPDNVLMGDSITFSPGKPAIITTARSAYAGDQKRFTVGFTDKTAGQDTAPQWQSPNPYGIETKTDFSIGSIKGTRYSIEYTQTVTGVTKGDKIYQYVFNLPGGKGLGAVYIQYAGDADNLKTVEQAIQSIVIK